jgi:hypothetical protein
MSLINIATDAGKNLAAQIIAELTAAAEQAIPVILEQAISSALAKFMGGGAAAAPAAAVAAPVAHVAAPAVVTHAS